MARAAAPRRADRSDRTNLARLSAIALVVVVLASACVGSARGDTDYRKKAVATTEHVRSSVRTVELAVEAARDDLAFGPFLSRVISQAEDDATSALGGFETIQPPSAAGDDLRSEVSELANDAIDVVADARIAARRGEISELADLLDRLHASGDTLEQFGQEHHA